MRQRRTSPWKGIALPASGGPGPTGSWRSFASLGFIIKNSKPGLLWSAVSSYQGWSGRGDLNPGPPEPHPKFTSMVANYINNLSPLERMILAVFP